ncbi:hypothetical protein FRC07_011977 [Ceratobasidium sp. 392]|nr:hypothetical protein FRC07_011977 [Ceratobasidium sp. 392]
MKTFQLALVLASLYAGTASQTSDPFKQYTVSAPDGSITAKFIGSGASLTELWVKDKYGRFRDVILGYDNRTLWQTDPNHPVFGSIVGSPNSPNTYKLYKNDHDGLATIHGGKIGWDRRNWTFAGTTRSSIAFTHFDPGDENFPGNVTAKVTYRLSPGGKFDTSVTATATDKTPIMLTSHIYWNLEAFQDGNKDIFDHYLRIAASKIIQGDDIEIPTGNFTQVQGTALDFRQERTIGSKWNESIGYGGCPVCIGYDNPWIYDRPNNAAPNLSLYSPKSGIKLQITSNQPVVQIYSGNWLQIPRKIAHGGPSLIYDQYSAVAIEPEGYIDAINNPEWGVDQIYYPGRDFKWASTYQFSVVK